MKNKKESNLAEYYFHQGTNYFAYQYLGVTIEIIDNKYIYTFRTWAPNAYNVALVSDFSGWETPLNMRKVSCGVCSGTGKNADGTPCRACKGTGIVDCHVCGGVGKIKRVKQETWLEHEPCHICNGRGMVACYQCHGTKERVCPECKGSGTVRNTCKIVLLAVMALLVIAMPVLAAIAALIGLGYCLFSIEQKNKEKAQNKRDYVTGPNREDAQMEFNDVE